MSQLSPEVAHAKKSPKVITIEAGPKYVKLGLLLPQMRNIADKIARLIYNKPLNDCLGKAQTVCQDTVQGKTFRLHLPGGRYSPYSQGDSKVAEVSKWIHSMTAHAKANKVDIEIVYV